jgi:protoheme IX farnesyltransferase
VGHTVLAYLELAKPRIAVLVLLSTYAGYHLGGGAASAWRVLWLLLGTGLVAAASSALNMCHERAADALMDRTRGRPLADGRLQVSQARWFALIVAVLGTGILCLWVEPMSAVLAAATFLLYVGVYTPLKRRTSLNTVVGAIPGALPPLIGFAAATGHVADRRAFLLFAILFLWQLPHFLSIAWLYRHDYARGGFVMMPADDPTGVATGRQILLHSAELWLVSLLPAVLDSAGRLYFYGALVSGLGFLGLGVPVALFRTEAWA